MLRKIMCLMVMCLLLGIGPVQGSIFVSTGQANANVTVDVAHTQYWTSTFPSGLQDLEGGVFAIKIGPDTTADITFDVIEGTYVSPFLKENGTYIVNSAYTSITPLLRVTLPASDFDNTYQPPTLFSVARTWNKLPRDPAGELVDLAPGTYTAILYTKAAVEGNVQYFLKGSEGTGGEITFADEDGNPVDQQGNLVPEPSMLAIWSLLGGLGIAGGWRRRKTV